MRRDMYYCSAHCIDHESSACPRCLAEQRHEELVALARDSIDQARESAEKHANPGDYRCPYCLYTTLNLGASRCPRCQGTVPDGHWTPVYAAAKARDEEVSRRALLAAQAWARGEPERRRAHLAATQRAATGQFAAVYFGYVLPAVTYECLFFLLSYTDRLPAGNNFDWSHLILLVPGVNWAGVIMAVRSEGPEQMLVLSALIPLAVVGLVATFVVRLRAVGIPYR